MQIIRMQYSEDMTQTVAVDMDGKVYHIPYPCHTWHKQAIDAFKGAGGEIEPYTPSQVYWMNSEKHMLHWPDELPEGATPAAPPETANVERIAEIKVGLDKIDFDSIRPLRAVNENTATDFDRNKLAELEEQAQALREELATLTTTS